MHLLDPYYDITPEALLRIVDNLDLAPQFALTRFTDINAQQLAKALIDSTKVNTVYLYFNEGINYTPALVSFLQALNQNPRTVGLNLQSVKLDDSCLEQISGILSKNI